MPKADVGDSSVHYETAGSGSAVVALLPQSTGPAGQQPLLRAIAKRHTAITIEQRGTPRSDPAPAEHSIETLADEVVAVLDAVELESAHLVCHSTGCGIGLSVTARWPTRVSALVLATPWAHADAHLTVMQTLRKAAAKALDPEQYARFNAALLFPPSYRRANERGFEKLARDALLAPQDADAIARRLDAILAFDARVHWPLIQCPTLVLSAGDDQLMPEWFAEQTAANIDGAKLVEFNTGGHMLPETRLEDFAATVLAFLSDVQSDQR